MGTRNLVLGRCAAVLFLCGAIASLPANALLDAGTDAYLLNLLALISAIVTVLIPWQRLHRNALHVLAAVATAEVTIAVAVHGEHAIVFMWYFVLVAVFCAYAFRRRREVIGQLAFVVLGMVLTAIHASPVEPDALENAIVGIPTICVAAGVVVWLRENLERRERTDPLTGLGNRRALMEALEATIAKRAVRLLVLFDLDGFKPYNDRLGHAAGDDLLARVGVALTAASAGRGEAFRLGGDELCVLLTDSEALADCEAALHEDGISASYGSAWLPHEADTASAALSLADDRMYAAKRASRGAPFVAAMDSETAPATASAPDSPSQTRLRSPSARDRHPGRSPANAPRPS